MTCIYHYGITQNSFTTLKATFRNYSNSFTIFGVIAAAFLQAPFFFFKVSLSSRVALAPSHFTHEEKFVPER